MVIGYGCAGFSLLLIGGEICKWIAFITNTTFVIYGLVGMVYLAVIPPIIVGLFDKVALIGCLIIGLLGVATIKQLILSSLK
jgi:hypothetical protein